MKHLITLVAGAILLTAPVAHALTPARAQAILASPRYEPGMAAGTWDDDYRVAVKHLVHRKRYADALQTLFYMDAHDGNESDRVTFVADIALVARAAGDDETYRRFAGLVHDLGTVGAANATCRESGDSYVIEAALPLAVGSRDELTERLCNAFTVGQSLDYAGRLFKDRFWYAELVKN